jgi:hypothetical protein
MRANVIILSVLSDHKTTAVVQVLDTNAVLKCQVRDCPPNIQKGQHATLCVYAYNPPVLEVNFEALTQATRETTREASTESTSRRKRMCFEAIKGAA